MYLGVDKEMDGKGLLPTLEPEEDPFVFELF